VRALQVRMSTRASKAQERFKIVCVWLDLCSTSGKMKVCSKCKVLMPLGQLQISDIFFLVETPILLSRVVKIVRDVSE
jgi:hypothetical protein